MRPHVAILSARWRLTVLYTCLFVLGGGAVVVITYELVAHNLRRSTTPRVDSSTQRAVARCVEAVETRGASSAMQKCAAIYGQGVQAGAAAQRHSTLTHLLAYSTLTLAAVALVAAGGGWIVAGRILHPVRQITAAARTASAHDLSQRIALQGPRDELRELADTFDAMLERLDRTFTGQRQFIANASHELRTPLTVMRTALDVVLARPDATRQELVIMSLEVRDAVTDAERLIDALLVLARNDRPRALTEPVDLADVTQDALDEHRSDRIAITADLAPATVTGDPTLLERLIENLLDNAERYNLDHGTIQVTTSCDDTSAYVRVVNTGPLIAPADIERLFLPFTRLDDRTHHQGSGLGLTLVRSIATVHDGTVQATPGPQGGLDITVRLSRRAAHAYETPNQQR